MKKIYKGYLKSALQAAVDRLFSKYEEKEHLTARMKQRSGGRYFRLAKQIDSKLFIFFEIDISPTQESFMCDIAWSDAGVFPDIGISTLRDEEIGEIMKRPEGLLGFGQIARQVSGEYVHNIWHVWTCSASEHDPDYTTICALELLQEVTDQEAKERVAGAIDSFVGDLDAYVMPFLYVLGEIHTGKTVE